MNPWHHNRNLLLVPIVHPLLKRNPASSHERIKSKKGKASGIHRSQMNEVRFSEGRDLVYGNSLDCLRWNETEKKNKKRGMLSMT